MQFKIYIGENIPMRIKRKFALYIFRKMKEELRYKVRRYHRKYEVRESLVLSSTLVKWNGKVPSHLNLPNYVENCLTLSYSYGDFYIKVDDRQLIRGSRTPVFLLIKMLEYGTEEIPRFPLVRKLFDYYSNNYLNLFTEFAEERAGDIL